MLLFFDPLSSGYPTPKAILAAHVGLDVMYYPELPTSVDPSYMNRCTMLKPMRFSNDKSPTEVKSVEKK